MDHDIGENSKLLKFKNQSQEAQTQTLVNYHF